jgi:[NiFe] hydrogenase assembly HybE family chaperone
MKGFEGSFLGNSERLDAESVLECGVCWWVYDPQKGDKVWQIPAGTAFNALPSHWRCPNCDAAQHQFMVLKGEPRELPAESADAPCAGERNIMQLQEQLLAAYRAVDKRMRSLPVHNPALEVSVNGLRRCVGGHAAVICTPWCMNILFVPQAPEHAAEGSTRDHAFPSGSYPLIRGFLDGIGVIESCSLFSPMDDFAAQHAADAVAIEAIEALFALPQGKAEEPAEAVDTGRRRFLGARVTESPSVR